jgi:hypothetical protein
MYPKEVVDYFVPSRERKFESWLWYIDKKWMGGADVESKVNTWRLLGSWNCRIRTKESSERKEDEVKVE